MKRMLLLSIIPIIVASCGNRHNSSQLEKGNYDLHISSVVSNNLPILIAEVLRMEDSVKIYGAGVFVNGKPIENNLADKSTGNIEFELKPGKYKFTGFGVHLAEVTTSKVRLNYGDTVRIVFYLAQENEDSN